MNIMKFAISAKRRGKEWPQAISRIILPSNETFQRDELAEVDECGAPFGPRKLRGVDLR